MTILNRADLSIKLPNLFECRSRAAYRQRRWDAAPSRMLREISWQEETQFPRPRSIWGRAARAWRMVSRRLSRAQRHVRDEAEHRAWWESTSCCMRPISVAVETRGLGTDPLILATVWWRSSVRQRRIQPMGTFHSRTRFKRKTAPRVTAWLGFWSSSIRCKQERRACSAGRTSAGAVEARSSAR